MSTHTSGRFSVRVPEAAQALTSNLVADQGLTGWFGTAVPVGTPRLGSEASFLVPEMFTDNTIMGPHYGSSQPQRDIRAYVGLYQSGQLLLDELATRTYPLEGIHDAIHDLEGGSSARGVLVL